jgi:hypothetical protein
MHGAAMGAANPNFARPVALHGFGVPGYFHMHRHACLRTFELKQNGTAVFGWGRGHLVRLPASSRGSAILIMVSGEATANNMR